MTDPYGNCLNWIEDIGNWINEKIIEPVSKFIDDIKKDFDDYDKSRIFRTPKKIQY